MTQTAPAPKRSDVTIVLIGISKLLEAALLFAIAVGMHKLLKNDMGDTIARWAHAVRVDPENRYVRALLTRLTGANPHRIEELSIGTFVYASVFGIEGIGLVLRKRWAEYLTVVTTGGFLPIEVYEIIHRVRLARVVIFIINTLIVLYLIYRLYREHRERKAAG